MFISPARSTYRQTWSWAIVAGFAFAGMLAFALYDYLDTRMFSPWIWGWAAFLAALLGFSWLWASRRTLRLHPEGVRYESLAGSRELRWEEVTETRYSQRNVNAAAHFGLLGLLAAALSRGQGHMSRTLKVVSPSGRITINSNFRDSEGAMHQVLKAVNSRLLPEREVQLQNGATISFGRLSLSSQGIIWKSKPPIPYSSISKCKLENQYLRVKAEGKWLDNIAVKSESVPNLFVFLDLVEKRCAAAGKPGLVGAMSGGSVDRYF